MMSWLPVTGTSSTGAQLVLMPHRPQLRSGQPGCQARAAARLLGVTRVEPAVGGRRRQLPPVRRPQPLHAAALLVDQHQDVGADGSALPSDETADLLGRRNVAREQDDRRTAARARSTAASPGVSSVPARAVMNADSMDQEAFRREPAMIRRATLGACPKAGSHLRENAPQYSVTQQPR